MAKTVQLKRGTTAQVNAYTGPVGEIVVDTDKDLPVVMDGVQIGGFAVAARANVDGSVSEINRTGTVTRTTSADGLDTSKRKRASSAGSATDASFQVVDTNNGLFAPADNAVGLTVNGAERMRVDSGANFSRVIPGGTTLYPDFACRAWANFDGAAATPVAPRAAGNISSIVRTATGVFTVTMAAPLPDAAYAALCGGQNGTNTFAGVIQPISSSQFQLVTQNAGGTDINYPNSYFAIFR